MKRLVIFSLIVAIVSGMAFAEVTVGGYVGAGADVVKGSTKEDSDVTSGGFHLARIQATAQNEEGTFGGVVRVYANGSWHLSDPGIGAYAWAWWKPIEMLRIQGGANPDSDFATNSIVGWGYHANDAEDYVAGHQNHYWTSGDVSFSRDTGFFGGFSSAGFTLSLTPIDRLAINLGLPFEAQAGLAEQVFGNMMAQVTYGIESVGDIAVTFQAGRGYKEDKQSTSYEVDPKAEEVIGISNDGKVSVYSPKSEVTGDAGYEEPSKIFASFYLSAIENMGLNIGVNFTLPYSDSSDSSDKKIQKPMEAGLGFSYNVNEAFNLKARLAATFMGSETPDGEDANPNPLQLGFGVLPSYDLGIMKVYLNAGFMFRAADQDSDGNEEQESLVGWHVNPYVTKSMGGGTFYFGLYAESTGQKTDDKTSIEWGIPVGIVFAF